MFKTIRRWLARDPHVFRRFTECSRVAMALANRFAHQCGAEAITPSCILYGLLDLGHGTCYSVLANLSVNIEEVKEQLSPACGLAEVGGAGAKLSQSSGCRRVVEQAIEEATAMGHEHITSGHMLLGVLLCGDDEAAALLAPRGVKPDDVRMKLREEMKSRGALRMERWKTRPVP